MLKLSVTDDGVQVAQVVMRPSGPPKAKGELQDYLVEITVDKGDSVGSHTRFVHDWPTNASNPLALAKAALALIDTGITAIEGDYNRGNVSPDLARGLSRAVRAIQTERQASELRNYRSALRSEQPEQHGRHSLGEATRPEDCQRSNPGTGYCYFQCGHGCTAAKDRS